jgi:hypothetical protein
LPARLSTNTKSFPAPFILVNSKTIGAHYSNPQVRAKIKTQNPKTGQESNSATEGFAAIAWP